MFYRVIFSVAMASVALFATDFEDAAIAYKKGDFSKAVVLFTAMCDKGNFVGCTTLGWMYGNGEGVEKDSLKAEAFYKKACDGNDALGCAALGMMYVLGDGVEQDSFKAMEFYTKSCDLKEEMGCKNKDKMKIQMAN